MSNFLDKLDSVTYARIGRSNIHGVGVIAIRDIPEGTQPFRYVKNPINVYHEKTSRIHKDAVANAPPYLKKLVKDFFFPDEKGYYEVPTDGFNALDISFYMNHSTTPNIDFIDNGTTFLEFIANRKIKKGEELVIDYKADV